MITVRKAVPAALHVHPTDPLDEYSDYSGLAAEDFSVRVWKEGALDAGVAAATTFSEVGATGEYRSQVTFPSIGFWVVEVRIGTPLQQIYREEYEVVEVTANDTLRGRVI